MRKIILLSCLCVFSLAVVAQKKWKVDERASAINFKIGHMGVSSTDGSFRKFSGVFTDNNGKFEGGSVTAEIEVRSIDTGNRGRDNHLQKNDFFDSKKFPVIKFTSTSITRKDSKSYRIDGNITMHGVTKAIAWGVEFNTADKLENGFKATASLNRADYDIGGGPTVGDTVEIFLEVQLVSM